MNNQCTKNQIFLEAGIDPKSLQRNFSLPSPIRRSSLTTAERSHSWDQTSHTAQANTHKSQPTTAHTIGQLPFGTAQIPPFCQIYKFTSAKGIYQQAKVLCQILRCLVKEEYKLRYHLLKPSPNLLLPNMTHYKHFYRSDGYGVGVEEQEPTSISAAIKSKVMGFFQRSFSPSRNSNSNYSPQSQSDFSRRSKVKDEEYRKTG